MYSRVYDNISNLALALKLILNFVLTKYDKTVLAQSGCALLLELSEMICCWNTVNEVEAIFQCI